MSIIVEPNITVESIELEIDQNSEYGSEKILKTLGNKIPLIKIGNYILEMGDLEYFKIRVALNSFPKFYITVADEFFKIRESLKNDIDKCVIVIGIENWYIKFNGLLKKTFSEAGDVSIELEGIIYNQKLYDTLQKSYLGFTISDILKDVCEISSMGLFTTSNQELNKTLNYCLRTGERNIDFLIDTIQNYTDNIWAFDWFYKYLSPRQIACFSQSG